MLAAPLPPNEPMRMAVLRSLQVLDSDPEPLADALVEAVASAFDAPIAAITLVDADRQWFKASVGLDVSETSRQASFCAHAILQDAPLVVPDAQVDVRFFDNPLVTGKPHIRFYAGCPIKIDGQAVGALCVIDHRPRACSAETYETLRSLSVAVEAWLAARSQLRAPVDHLIRALHEVPTSSPNAE